MEGTPIKPNHYKITIKGTEYQVRDVIEAVIRDMPGIRAGYVFNVLKYVFRAEKKNKKQDYEKAREYLDYIIDNYNEEKKWIKKEF